MKTFKEYLDENDEQPIKEPVKKIVTYKHNYKTWVAFHTDEEGNQIGNCEYGPTKKHAVNNLKIEND